MKPTNSLVLASLEIGRVLADHDRVPFRAKGTCMYPAVRPGDVLRVKSCVAADVSVGDIAVCRGQDFLFGHRVIGKGLRDGRPFIVTRPDRAHDGNNSPAFDDDLLGVVIAIERNGKTVPLQPTGYSQPARLYYTGRLALIEAASRLRHGLTNAVGRMQDRRLYRRAAHAWFKLARPRVSFVVRVPLNAKLGDILYCRLRPDEFDTRKMDRWTLALHLNGARQPAAWATFERTAENAFRIDESHVRLAYRGAGLEVALQRQAEKILQRSY